MTDGTKSAPDDPGHSAAECSLDFCGRLPGPRRYRHVPVPQEVPPVKKGDRYNWRGVRVTVLRVARDGSWADIQCTSNNNTWTKRQKLPLSAEWIPAPSEGES